MVLAELLVGTSMVSSVDSKLVATKNASATLSDLQGFPWAHCEVGDVDRDGLADFALAATESDVVYIHSARRGERLLSVKSSGKERFGRSLASVADCDNDGVADFAVSTGGGLVLLSSATGEVLSKYSPCDGAEDAIVGSAVGGESRGRKILALIHSLEDDSRHMHTVDVDGMADLAVIEVPNNSRLRVYGAPDFGGDGCGDLVIEYLSDGSRHLTVVDARSGMVETGLSCSWLSAFAFDRVADRRPSVIGICGGAVGVYSLSSGVFDESFAVDIPSEGGFVGGVSLSVGCSNSGDEEGSYYLIVWNQDSTSEASPGEGRAQVLSGTTGDPLAVFRGTSWDDLSWGEWLEDINGDGICEFMVGGGPLTAAPDPSPRPLYVVDGHSGALIYRLPEKEFLP